MAEESSENIIVDLPIKAGIKSESGPQRALNRRLEIAEQYVKIYGLSNARVFTKQLSEKYKVGVRQIRKDFNWIKGNFKPEDIQQVKLDLKILRDKTLNNAIANISGATTFQERNDSIKTAWIVIEKYREDLEAWGEKEKVAEKLEVKGPTKLTLEIIDGRSDESGDEVGSANENPPKEH
jgi:hypothetical protein